MKKYLFPLLIIMICISCKERQRVGAFQGVWYKQGFEIEAFIVRSDSIYFPGLKKGYPYQLHKDTLSITFTEMTSKSKIISFSSEEILVWDMSLSKDTILLKRESTPFLDTIPKGVANN